MNSDLLTSLGAALSIFLSAAGASVATAPSGLFASKCNGNLFMSFAPTAISGVLAIYGCIIAVLLAGKLNSTMEENVTAGYKHLAAGMACGFACLVSGFGMSNFMDRHMKSLAAQSAIKKHAMAMHNNNNNNGSTNGHHNDTSLLANEGMPLLGDNGNNGHATTEEGMIDVEFPAPSVRVLMVLVFLEAIGLYGLIVGLLLIGTDSNVSAPALK